MHVQRRSGNVPLPPDDGIGVATVSSRTLLATARPLVRNARPTTATDTRTTTQEGRGTGGDGRADKRSGRGADTSPLHGTAGAGAWDTEKPRERSRGHGKQRARHGMEWACGWAKGARVLTRFPRRGVGRGGKHDEGLRGVQDTSAATFMQLRTARRARAAGCGAVGAGPCTAPSTLEERPAAGGRAAGAALEHDMAVRSGRERAPGRRPHDEPGALGLAWVRISAARQPPARAASQPSLQRPPPRRPPFVHPPSSCFVRSPVRERREY